MLVKLKKENTCTHVHTHVRNKETNNKTQSNRSLTELLRHRLGFLALSFDDGCADLNTLVVITEPRIFG